MKLPPNVKLDDNAKQLLGLKPFDDLEEGGFDVDIPVQLLPMGIVNGWSVSVEGIEDFANSINQEAEDIKLAVKKALKGVAVDLKRALDAALKSSAWRWPTGGSRDIYDTGALLSSGSVTVNGYSLAVKYGASYASIVHNGGYIFPYGNKNLRPIYLPGRPWITSTLYGGGPVPQFDFNASLKRYLRG